MEDIIKGRYRHFKGNEYEVLYTAKHSETEEELVVYRALYGERGVWVRPASMWNEEIERDGKRFRRFTLIEAYEPRETDGAGEKKRGIPVLQLEGYSGSGKTTLIEKLLPILNAAGLRVATVKHDAHGEASDPEGTDSFRHFQAGAASVIVTGPDRTEIVTREALTVTETVKRCSGADLILMEGFKHADLTKIGLSRRETGKGFTDELSRFAALVTDEAPEESPCPVFHPDDAEGIADFILKNMYIFSKTNE